LGSLGDIELVLGHVCVLTECLGIGRLGEGSRRCIRVVTGSAGAGLAGVGWVSFFYLIAKPLQRMGLLPSCCFISISVSVNTTVGWALEK